MNKKDLKDLIKPLIKECIEETLTETILTSGILSQVISEVLKGVNNSVIVENKTNNEETRMSQIAKQSEKRQISESRKQMMDAIGKTSYGGVNIFEGIKETIPDEKPSVANPLSGIAAHDPGVDITQLFDFNKAKILAQGKKRQK